MPKAQEVYVQTLRFGGTVRVLEYRARSPFGVPRVVVEIVDSARAVVSTHGIRPEGWTRSVEQLTGEPINFGNAIEQAT